MSDLLWDLLILRLRIEACAVPMVHADTARYWVAQLERDIYAETVQALGYDPLAVTR